MADKNYSVLIKKAAACITHAAAFLKIKRQPNGCRRGVSYWERISSAVIKTVFGWAAAYSFTPSVKPDKENR